MCQINTDPMKSQVGYLNVVVPPDILDTGTSTDMVVREGSNVSFQCAASGSPPPSITWRKENGEPIVLPSGEEVISADGPVLNISRVSRLHMGAYLCIASNGVPPTVSKRISLIVHFPPMVWIQNQLVGAMEGDRMTLECHSEAFPKSINYWTGDRDEIIAHSSKYEPVTIENQYKIHMKLTINDVGKSDFGSYKCVSKNSLGDTDGTIKLYPITRPSTNRPKHKDKSRRKYGPNDIDPGMSAKQRELRGSQSEEPEDYEFDDAITPQPFLLLIVFGASAASLRL
uniref:Lachesin n=1 Tax=Lygus hesperus TaxID=30085 RepID=A0A0A9VWP6_LYGHE